jgi:tetratricopeptide (TPR) repeat protein
MVDLSKHLENAADAVKRRNFPLAIKIYSQVLQVQPDYGDARAGLRKALFAKAAVKRPGRLGAVLFGGVHLLTGSLCRLLGQHAAAARAYERYLVHDPLSEGANLALGTALERAGHRKSALAAYRAYAEHEPRCLPACRSAGALLYEQGQLNDALQMYEQALKVDPRDQQSLKARKDLAAEGALASTGIETAQSSRELIKDKQAAQKLEQRQRLQLTPEELEEELMQLEEQLQERPEDVALLERIAALREMQKDLQGALDCLERAVQLAPDRADLQERCGDMRLRLQERYVQKALARGDAAAAERAERALDEARVVEFRRRIERNPTDLSLRYELGSALLGIGELDAAVAELQQAVKDPRKKAAAQQLLGRAFQQKGLHDLALGQYEKVVDAAGSTGSLAKDALYSMGALCEELGRRDEALQHYGRIIEQDIGFKDVSTRIESLKSKTT